MSNLTNTRYLESLERPGITQQPNGLKVTRRLAERFGIAPGRRSLDLGCGTAYTACGLQKGITSTSSR